LEKTIMHQLAQQSTADVLRQITQQSAKPAPQPAPIEKAAPQINPEELARIVSEAIVRALTEVYAQLKLPVPQVTVNVPAPVVNVAPELKVPVMREETTVIYGKDGRIQGSFKEIRPSNP
jgi:hypothetical protein